MPEFQPQALDALLQPLESREAATARGPSRDLSREPATPGVNEPSFDCKRSNGCAAPLSMQTVPEMFL
jgi:hypothetical protein